MFKKDVFSQSETELMSSIRNSPKLPVFQIRIMHLNCRQVKTP